MLCAEGVIIAADQAASMGDGSKTSTMKVDSGFGESCSFAIANTSNDGNAALTLQGNIVRALMASDPAYVSDAEAIIIEQMSLWSAAWSIPPETQFIIGFCGSGSLPGDPGNVLLFASPPNTMLRRTLNDDSRGYEAIGSGSAVTNPLHSTYLKGLGTAQQSLSKIAYLMDKAKKGNIYCGGRTNAVLVRQRGVQPDYISPLDMEAAERISGNLDFFLQWSSSCFFGQTDEGAKQLADGLANAIQTHGSGLRNMVFRTLQGEVIYDTSVQAPRPSEESA